LHCAGPVDRWGDRSDDPHHEDPDPDDPHHEDPDPADPHHEDPDPDDPHHEDPDPADPHHEDPDPGAASPRHRQPPEAQIQSSAAVVLRRQHQRRRDAGDSTTHHHPRGNHPPHLVGCPELVDCRPDLPFRDGAALPTHWVEASGTLDGDLRTVT
jgi:hypothetical protein